jgi:hypothetical protein
MPRTAAFARPAHRQVAQILAAMDREFLERAHCFFGGGTRIVLELGEYRESRDIDFLCASREGYRLLRETVADKSLGALFAAPIALAREVRADQYGIRTFLAEGESRLKFEVIREGRIDLEGSAVRRMAVPCLTRKHCFAEKFLANADRGLDTSTLSRDVIDLAFMAHGWDKAEAEAGLAIAESAYGQSVRRTLRASRKRLREDKAYRNRCIEGLAIVASKTLTAGLNALAAFE